MSQTVFYGVLPFHILGGLTCVITGAVAMLSKKRPGRHPRFGEIYFWALGFVFASATVLALLRWAQDYYLFFIGAVAFGCALVGHLARKVRWDGWLYSHITGMGMSYVALLTAFYVDNGPNLPVWQLLPHIVYWVLPSVLGVPLMAWALLRHRGCAGVELRTR